MALNQLFEPGRPPLQFTVFLFPGQGSQSLGMGREFYTEYDFVRELFEMASDIVQINLARLCFEGPLERLTETINLQPALTTVNLACHQVLRHHGVMPHVTAGHSLGEYSALCAAEVLTPEATLHLVLKRGQLMQREAQAHPGVMQAVVGLDIHTVTQMVIQARPQGVVAVANHNTERQIVITGEKAAVDVVAQAALDAGARAIPLKVSGAWHSPLMAGAADEFADCLARFDFQPPRIPVFLNVTGNVVATADDIRSMMARQLESPVRWYDAMQKLAARDEARDENWMAVEVGPGRVLSGLLKQILPKKTPVQMLNVSGMRQLEEVLKVI